MAITGKELAHQYFQQAVSLEKIKRAQGAQNFDEVVKLYKRALELDPTHEHVRHNMNILDRDVWMRHLNNLLIQARGLRREGNDYEMGKYSNGVPNAIEAIKKYQEAKNVYDRLISKLDGELTGRHVKQIDYINKIVDIKRIVIEEKSRLPNIIARNDHYRNGLIYEERVGSTDKTTSFTDYIDLCKKAESEYKKAEDLDHNGARSRYARLLYHIEGQISKAIDLYKSASAAGDAEAMNELGILYAKGKVNGKIERDKAIEYYDGAIALNYTNAMLNRAALHEEDKEYDKAIELYQKADSLGDKRANALSQQAKLLAEAQVINPLKRPSTNALEKENISADGTKASSQKRRKMMSDGMALFSATQPMLTVMQLRANFLPLPASGIKRPTNETIQSPAAIAANRFSVFSSGNDRPSIYRSPAKERRIETITSVVPNSMAITATNS